MIFELRAFHFFFTNKTDLVKDFMVRCRSVGVAGKNCLEETHFAYENENFDVQVNVTSSGGSETNDTNLVSHTGLGRDGWRTSSHTKNV